MPLSVSVSVSFSNTACLGILLIVKPAVIQFDFLCLCLSNLTLFKGIHVLMIWEILLSRMS